jgi:hypothetical protein
MSTENAMRELSIIVNNTEYQLNESLRELIEQRIKSEYGDNNFLEYYWTIENNDPVVKIETEGNRVPWDKLSEFEVNKDNDKDQDNDNTSPTSNSTASNQSPKSSGASHHGQGGLMKMPRNNTSNTTSNTNTNTNEHDEVDDYKKVMFPESYRPFPDPDDQNFGTLPPMPDEFDEDENEETLVIPIPENQRSERWAAGEAIIPVYSTITWNLQKRADSIPRYGTRDSKTQSITQDSTVSNTTTPINSHDEWETLLRESNCPIINSNSNPNPDTRSQNEQSRDEDSVLNTYEEASDTGPKYSDSKQNFTI